MPGFGEYYEKGKATLDIAQAPAGLKEGMSVVLQVAGGKQRARVTEMTETTFTLDANHPLAGKKLELDVELLAVDPGAKAHETATFAGGCFWGVELAYQREPGVVGTKVRCPLRSNAAPNQLRGRLMFGPRLDAGGLRTGRDGEPHIRAGVLRCDGAHGGGAGGLQPLCGQLRATLQPAHRGASTAHGPPPRPAPPAPAPTPSCDDDKHANRTDGASKCRATSYTDA